MAVVINIVALIVFVTIAVLLSQNRAAINRKAVARLFALNIFIGWFLTSFTIGRELIVAFAEAFTAVLSIAYEGVAFALPNRVNVPQMNFVTTALTAIPLNVINALMVSHILYPVEVSLEEDNAVFVDEEEEKKLPFFNFPGNSIIGAGKLVFIVTCMVIAFVSLARLINAGLALINPSVNMEAALGLVMFPFAWLLNPDTAEAFQLAQFMGTKLVTNEFVVMLQAQPLIETFSRHMQCVLTVFVTSFANLGTVGILLGTFSGIVDAEKNALISKNVKYIILSGILVSLLSAGIACLFTR